jgi:3-oxoacyl-[acyl-carrier-protein] synthase II
MTTPEIVITGLGAISPFGTGMQDLWQGLCSGKCAIDAITAFDPSGFTCKLAGEAPNFKISKHLPKSYRKAGKLMSRDIQLAIVAAEEAIKSAGLVTKASGMENINITPRRTATNVGAGLISCDLAELSPAVGKSITDGKFDIRKWGKDGIEALTPIWLLKYLPNMPACHIGIIHDFQGPSNSITCGEASAQLALAEAVDVIRRGTADMALTGGCEAKVNPLLMLRQCILKRSTSSNNDDPQTACRPFDAEAKGSVFGEGAGMMIIETVDHAKKRNAKIYAKIAGTGSSNSLSNSYEHLETDGKGLQFAIENALADAGIGPDEIDLIIPHGTGIAQDDLAEAAAIENTLGSVAKEIPTWPTKSMLSNTGAASGALDMITAVMAISEGKIGAGKNCDNKAAGCNLNITTQLQQKDIRYALCTSYTFGGQTSAVILKKN